MRIWERLSYLADILKWLFPLVEFVRRLWRRNSDQRAESGRLLCIVSRRDRRLYTILKRTFANGPDVVEVILDRRRGERRRRTSPRRVERRKRERRSFDIDGSLLRRGWAFAATKDELTLSGRIA